MPETDPTAQLTEMLQTLRSNTATPQDILKAGSFLVQHNHYDHYLEIIDILSSYKTEFEDNVEWHYCMGMCKVTQHDPVASIPHLLNTLSQITNISDIYQALTWAYLQTENWAQAYLSSSAGINNCEDKGMLPNLQHLANVRFQGHEFVKFNLDGIDYKFALFTSNTQEIVASRHHLSSQFTEKDELAMIRSKVGHVDAVAEVGCLDGNHSVFFLKNLTPSVLTIFDASQTSLNHAKINVELNQAETPATDVNFVHSAIGKESGSITFFNEKVDVNPLDKLLTRHYDFIKIDVDSMEIEALQGAFNYIQEHRPKIMIEVLHMLKTPFVEFLASVNYRIVDQINTLDYGNYLIFPGEG
jgi:hypothetical protein